MHEDPQRLLKLDFEREQLERANAERECARSVVVRDEQRRDARFVEPHQVDGLRKVSKQHMTPNQHTTHMYCS